MQLKSLLCVGLLSIHIFMESEDLCKNKNVCDTVVCLWQYCCQHMCVHGSILDRCGQQQSLELVANQV